MRWIIMSWIYTGAGLVTSATLLWLNLGTFEVSVVRLPAAALAASSLMMLLLGILLQAGLGASAVRRNIMITYVAGMSALVVCEVAAAGWGAWHLYCVYVYQDSSSQQITSFVQKINPGKPMVIPLCVAGALLVLCVALQVVSVILAALARSSYDTTRPRCNSNDASTLLLSCMGPKTNIPRCLRPLSGADYMPSDPPAYLAREHNSSRRSRRSKGWQLQPQVGWNKH
ncbi:uncharacterized protein LOC128672062 isoform X2 [Plodia interpunctella]|uniref:uncharacterized protein LOC128672062 isoform X2 n=1 Tax=Plodia interpunctella TaxID=58824 RepID=UPI002367E9AB|nr:uncharacterized protein LOC128672062 isoform X2 [Plodia interpunctella]